ncbi:MAG TPA: Gfo/Idh/MocA family oxidoreductase [Gaiellaceae bacterium]
MTTAVERASTRRGGFADVRAAIVGTGFMAWVHADALRRLGVQLTGVVGSSHERALAQAERSALPAPYADLDAMLSDPSVDVVHITTPNHVHFEHASAALRAGKHVICEKPLATTVAEADELVELAGASGKICAVNFNNRYYGQVQELRRLIAAGELGRIYAVHGIYLQDWLLGSSDWNWRIDPALGGPLRVVADIGVHWLDLAEFVTGLRVEAVLADLARFIDPRGGRSVETEDAAFALLRFAGGGRGTLTLSQVSAGRKNRLGLEIDGSEAAAAWISETCEELWIGRRHAPSTIGAREPRLVAPGSRPELPPGHTEGFTDTFMRLYAAVYSAILGAPSDGFPTFDDGRRAVMLADAVGRSARAERWVPIDE